MLSIVSLALAALPSISMGEGVPRQVEGSDDLITLRPSTDGYEDRVVGGTPTPLGEWDDAVGIVVGGGVSCTGTLVAPNVVITAAHCNVGISGVLIGSKDYYSNQGEYLEVSDVYVHPSYDGYYGYDFAVLKLRGESSYPHRVIGNDCILDEELYDGAPVSIVGFGATQQDGGGYNSRLMWAESVVRDAGCERNQLDGIATGCLDELRPGGEIIAGGRVDLDGDGTIDQSDACFGDSGGPLYLHTSRGEFVIGVTSRSMIGIDPNRPCRDGGIWVRPDAVMTFIENRTGVTLDRPTCTDIPAVEIGDLVARPGGSDDTKVEVDDPDGQSFTVDIAEQPTLGILTFDGERLVLSAYEGVEGAETVMVTVTDDGNPAYPDSPAASVEVPVDIVVKRGACGCASSGAGWGSLLGLVGLAGLFRRRS